MCDVRVQEELESSIVPRVFGTSNIEQAICFTEAANGKTKHDERIP
jgi:hypothetical protein